VEGLIAPIDDASGQRRGPRHRFPLCRGVAGHETDQNDGNRNSVDCHPRAHSGRLTPCDICARFRRLVRKGGLARSYRSDLRKISESRFAQSARIAKMVA
jgi:hypothetical protein